MSDVAELMKRCQRGVGGRNALDEAHDIMAECYGTLGRLESERAALEAERDALRAEISDLHTTMMAAAVEIQEHWAAHCDEEGYGPANLMHRLERGIASQYGYTAQALVQLKAERDALRQQLADSDAALRESRANDTAAMGHLADMRQQRRERFEAAYREQFGRLPQNWNESLAKYFDAHGQGAWWAWNTALSELTR